MKKLCLTVSIAVFLLFLLNGLQAQTAQAKLNQIELMKKIIGSWKCEVAKDTTAFFTWRFCGTGVEGEFKYVTKGKTVLEGVALYGFDKSIDKYVGTQMIKGKDIVIYVTWFTSNNKYEAVLHNDISAPDKASMKWQGEIKSPDLFVETTIVNNKPMKTDTYTRVK